MYVEIYTDDTSGPDFLPGDSSGRYLSPSASSLLLPAVLASLLGHGMTWASAGGRKRKLIRPWF